MGTFECECCETGCEIAADDFQREILGAGWSQQAGTWGMVNITGGSPANDGAVTTSDANAYLRFETAHPSGVAEHVVLAALSINNSYYTIGDKARIVLCDTLYAELEYGFRAFGSEHVTSSGCLILRIFNGGTLVQESPPLRVTLTGGFTGIATWAGYSATTGVLWAAVAVHDGVIPSQVRVAENVGTVSGTKVGLGTGDTVAGTIAFTDFHYYQHNYGVTVTDCYGPGAETQPGCQFAWPWYRDAGTSITDVGCGWHIIAGTWDAVQSLSDYYTQHPDYLQTASANALIECIQDQSAWNCSEYTDFGYQKATAGVALGAKGDTFRLYVDWDGTDGHWVEVTCGDANVVGVPNGSVVTVGKGATTLETFEPLYGPEPGHGFSVQLCTVKSNDGSGLDAIGAYVYGSYPDTWQVRLVSATTVYGHKRVAVGTGATVNSWMRVSQVNGYANVNACEDCHLVDCVHCPGGDSPRGLSIEISGFTTPHGSLCDCTVLNATYVAPVTTPSVASGACSGGATWLLCTIAGFGGGPVYFKLGWTITATATGWKLSVTVEFDLTFLYGGTRYSVEYSKEFTMSQRCDEIAGEVLAFEGAVPYGIPCSSGITTLTVTVTAY
jgi:hypothetical protein